MTFWRVWRRGRRSRTPRCWPTGACTTARRHTPAPKADTKLSLRELRAHVQTLLDANSQLVVETGDSWFNGQKLTLPAGAGYHFQMQYGSIGWSTGATLGRGHRGRSRPSGRLRSSATARSS